MKQVLINFLKSIEPKKEQKILHTAYDAFFTFAFTPNETTHGGVHIRDGMDLKRTMVHVVIALQLCYLFGTWNIGHQHFVALGEHTGVIEGLHLKLFYGLVQLLPIWIVTHLVGLGIEFFYAAKKGHSVEEGFLVSGALIPLIMPPDIPLWILAISVAFAVIIGKEAFGGTGMNIWNIALLSRVFIFFAYPTTISGDEVWVAGLSSTVSGSLVDYGWIHTSIFNPLFSSLGLSTYDAAAKVVDGYSGATPLILAYQGGWDKVTDVYTPAQMIWGTIPGSIGETSKIFVIFGLIFLIVTKIADWRIILSFLIGAASMGLILNVWGATPFMQVPWYNHFIMGSLLFAAAFMATDPVTAASTGIGKWVYGFLIGMVGIIIRVLNPAYPEGWMLAILFMNMFSPLIDYYVLQANMTRRAKRVLARA
ncbi:MAG: NADH:ubiquinone reductase (Na(+)-transporting) subunit B [Saprospiraceae bacterium]|nr:NADH:ubiquinone reductase (Na(+)-transporting) subunit B [Saprospiraceae bacterium]